MQRHELKELLSDWHEWLPLAGIAVLAIVGIVLWLRRTPETETDIERQRRAYLNRVGRIVEGQVLEVVDHHPGDTQVPGAKPSGILPKRSPASALSNGTQKLLYYPYSISGVTYETAQDITGLKKPRTSGTRRRRPNRQRKIRPLQSEQLNPSSRRLVGPALTDSWRALKLAISRFAIH